MSILEQLLTRWAELESDRCTRIGKHRPWFQLTIAESFFDIDCEASPDDRIGARTRSYLQLALQAAIVTHGLRLKLENDAAGWHSSLLAPDGLFFADLSSEAEIAMLRAYLRWLERVAEGQEAAA